MRLPRAPLLLLLSLLPSVALADPRDDARRHFRAGLEAAAADDYRGAVDEFLAAYAAIPHPATAYNIAKAYEDLGDVEDALFWYRRFQEMDPQRAEVADEPVARLSAALAPPEPTGVTLPSDPDEARERLEQVEAERARLLEMLGEGTEEASEPAELPAAPEAVEETPPAGPPTSRGEGTADERGFLTDAYGKVIVTASRYNEDPLMSPSSVTVITQDDIRMSGAVHLADVLRRVVGVDVMNLAASTPYLGIRGFNGELTNKVLWLVDGRPANLDFLGTPLPFTLQVPMEAIERIEIIRGPGSAIYGANAVTGVVNIITRLPGEGPTFAGTMEGGWNRYLRGAGVASGGVGPFTFRASAQFQQEGRFQTELREDVLGDPIEPFVRDPSLGERRVTAGGRFDARFADKGWASLSGAWSSGFTEFHAQAALGNFGLEGQTGHIRGDIAYGPFHARGYWMREDGRTAPWLASAGNAGRVEAYVRSDVGDIEVEGNFDAVSGEVEHRIHVGGGFTRKIYRAGQLGEGFEIPRFENHGKVFAQYQLGWRFLQFTGSLRWDANPLLPLDSTISPRGAFVFRLAPHTALRMSGGTAFRAQNALESYVNLDLNTAADGYFVEFFGAVTNPEGQGLRAERITSAELGVKDESSSWHQLDAAVYWNRVTDLITIGSVEPTLSYFQEDGAGYPFGAASWVNDRGTTYDAVGGELDLTFFPVDGLDVFANTSIERIFATVDGGDGFIDRATALARVNLGVQYRSPWRLDLTVSGHYTSRQTFRIPSFDDRGNIVIVEESIPDRVLVVTRLAGRPLENPDLELGVTLWNPLGFGTSYLEHPNGQRIGPRLYGEASVRF